MGTTAYGSGGFDRPGGTTPEDYARSIVRPPILSSDGRGWKDISLHRFDVPHFSTTLGASRVHRLTLQLEGTVLIERSRDGHRDRKWSDKGISNLVPAGVPVSRSFRGRSDFISFYLAPGVVEEVAADTFDVHADRVRLVESFAVQDDVLARFGLLLKAEAETGGEGTCLFTDTLNRALALHLLRTYSAGSPRAPTAPQPLVGWRLRRTIDYMQEHITENLPLTRLAAAAGLSPSHLARSFRAATGQPPHRYLIRLRIDMAREMLEHTRLPIIDVGARCGFEQTTHFATMFRKVTGMSPRAYRAARCG